MRSSGLSLINGSHEIQAWNADIDDDYHWGPGQAELAKMPMHGFEKALIESVFNPIRREIG
jgi:hypothetical protein